MSDLIDTTEMYLKTVFEMEEDGVPPLRARIVERLGHSGPTVSQTVSRMERDGLLVVRGDRHIVLSDAGREIAREVMVKHRVAERLLLDVIGLSWEQVHAEACRWEHVMSDAVQARLATLLGEPSTDPYGNPIPGQGEPRQEISLPDALDATGGQVRVRIARIGEPVQAEEGMLAELATLGVRPGAEVTIADAKGGVAITSPAGTVELNTHLARHLFAESLDG